MNNLTIGTKLAIAEHRLKIEDLQAARQVRRQRWANNLMIWFTILLIGIALGYHWRMKQEQYFQIKANISIPEHSSIAYNITAMRIYKISRKYLTGGTNSWLEEI